MRMYLREDTIAAVATPRGTGGVAIIRISGKDAHAIVRRIFSYAGEYEHGRMHYGAVMQSGRKVDSGYAVMFYGPQSYTGEDTAELHIHGGAVVTAQVLALVTQNGARPAQPGEFTRRAFMNGKMDLTQAEAVCDLISAAGEAAARASLRQMDGDLRDEVNGFQDELTDLIAEVEAAVEYPEEDLELEIMDQALPRISDLKNRIAALAQTFISGHILRDGLDIVIAGKPNVGKSSLFNALVGMDRSIVSDSPGTTRDTVERMISVDGITLNLMDTAGIRDTEDAIEDEGVKRSVTAANSSELTLFVLDSTQGIADEDRSVYNRLKEGQHELMVVWNKFDLSERPLGNDDFATFGGISQIPVSAKTRYGIPNLINRICGYAAKGSSGEGTVITNERHRFLLEKAAGALDEAAAALASGMDMDCVTIDLNEAWNALGEVTGRTVNEDIIDRIFEKFCLGK